MVRFQTAMSAIAMLVATQVAFAQQRTETKSSNAPIATGTRGSLVQQLRSLSDEAINTLDQAEERAGVVAVQGRTTVPPKSFPGPPQPTGRAILRRTNDSPWLERFEQENSASSQPLPRPRSSSSTGKGKLSSGSSAGVARQVSVSGSNAKSQQPGQPVVSPKPGPTQYRLSDTNETQRKQSSSTPRLLLGDSNRTVAPTPMPPKALANPELADAYPSQVEVLEQLPSSVRASLIGETDFDTPTDDSTIASGQSTSSPLSTSLPALDEIADGELQETEPRNTAGRLSENKLAVTPVATPPKVSRIPLPSQQTIRREPVETKGNLVEQNSAPNSATAPAAELPQSSSELDHVTVSEETTFSLDTSADRSAPQAKALPSEPLRSDDQPLALPPSRESQVPGQLASSPKAARKPLPLPGSAPIDEPVAEQKTAPEATRLPSAPALTSQTTPTTGKSNLPDIQVAQQRLQSNDSQVRSDRIRSDKANRQSPPPSSNARISMDSPRLKVAFEGPQTLPVNEPASYNIIVHNSDVIPLHGIIVRMDVPAGVMAKTFQPTHGKINVEKTGDGMTLLTWEFQALAGSDVAKAPVQFTAKESRNFPVAMEWTLVPMDASSQIEVLSPELKVALEGPAEVVFGQSNAYRLRVRNPGTAEAKAVKLRLTAGQYGASEIDLGTIAAGGEEVVEVDLTFNESGAINIAAVASLEGNKSASSAIDVLVTQADLKTSIQLPSVVFRGTATRVSVDVVNQGNADATNTTATIELPMHCVVSTLPPDASLDRNRMIWRIGKLTRGQKRSLELVVDNMNEGENEFRVSVTNTAGTPAKFAAKTNVQAVADLKLLVNDPIAPAPVGGEVVYELTLTNRGSKAADNVKIIAQFSEGVEPIKAEGHQFRIVPGQVFFDSIRRIEPGATVSLKIYAKADRDGMHRFRAEIRSEGSDFKLVQEESTQYLGEVSRTATTPSAPLLR